MGLWNGIGLSSNVAASSGGGAPWTPASAPGLVLWVENDATTMFKDAGVTPAVAGTDTIQQWNDKSGNGHHLLQATAGNRPSLQTASGKLYASFNGTAGTMATGAEFSATDASGQHWIAISGYFNTNTGTQAAASIDAGSALSHADTSWFRSATGTSSAVSFDTSAAAISDTGNAITAATPTVIIATVTSTAAEIFVDNVTNGSTALTGTRQIGKVVYVGARGSFTDWMGGRIYGIVEGTGTLSSSDRANLQAYMAGLHP